MSERATSKKRTQCRMLSVCALPSLFVVLLSEPASADDRTATVSPSSIETAHGARVGIASGVALIPVGPSQHMTLAPIAIDVGARLSDTIELAGIAEFAPSIGGGCTQPAPGTLGLTVGSCQGWRTRIGMRARVHFAPSWVADPWFATGFSVDVLDVPGFTESPENKPFVGFSLPHVELGVDLRVARNFSIAPYASADLGVWVTTLGGRSPPSWAANEPQYSLATGVRAAYTF